MEYPGSLTHYTTPAGFLGIINSCSLRSTHTGHMNDAAETQEGEAIAGEASSPRSEEDSESIGYHFKTQGFDPPTFGKLGEAFLVDSLFVTSLTQHKDDLGMWRSYGVDERIAIEFDTAALLDAIARNNRLLGPGGLVLAEPKLIQATYDRDLLIRTVHELCRRWDENEPGGANLFSEVMLNATSYKGERWLAEAEWRLVTLLHTHNGETPPGIVEFRQGVFGLTPFISLHLAPKDTPFPYELIRTVVAGPGYKQKESLAALELMGELCGFAVYGSDHPLRG